MYFLTLEQHQEVVHRLCNLVRNHVHRIPYHSSGIGYPSVMMCFLQHNLSVAETLLRLAGVVSNEWFPVTVGYTIVRTMFEIDVNAHYITKDPLNRALQYMEFGRVLNKRKVDVCSKHRNSKDPQWQEFTNLMWNQHWARQERDVIGKYEAIAAKFTHKDKKGKRPFQNWSGKSLRQMAEDVNHLEAYDIFYAELSSFAHGDVHLSDRFLRHDNDGHIWT